MQICALGRSAEFVVILANFRGHATAGWKDSAFEAGERKTKAESHTVEFMIAVVVDADVNSTQDA